MTTDTKPVVERVYPPKIMILFANPIMRMLLRRPGSGPSKALMLLSFKGRKSGKQFDVPVAKQSIDGQLAVLSNSPWRHNFRDGYDTSLWLDGKRRTATGTLVTDPERVGRAYQIALADVGLDKARRTGLRINADRQPTAQELADAVRRYGLSYITFTLTD